MKATSVSITTQHNAGTKTLPMNFFPRLLLSVPLMAVAGFCLFGFVATFEPMPRIEQWAWRGVYAGVGGAAVFAICWMWLIRKSSTRRES